MYRQRALSSSQVSSWFGYGPIVVPSRQQIQSFPQFIEALSTYNGNSSTITTPTPSSVVTNDLIIVAAYANEGATQREVYAPTAAGLTFTNLWTHPTNASSNGLKRVDWALSPDNTARAVQYTCVPNYTWSAQIIIVRGVDTTTPFEVQTAWTTPTSTTTPAFNGITTSNFSKVMAIVQDTSNITVGSSGWAQHYSGNIGTGINSLVASLNVGNPGVVGGPTFSSSGTSNGFGLVFGVRASPPA